MRIKEIEIPEQLIDAHRQQKLVIFAGAGYQSIFLLAYQISKNSLSRFRVIPRTYLTR